LLEKKYYRHVSPPRYTASFKERDSVLEERVRSLQEENELLYGKLTQGKMI